MMEPTQPSENKRRRHQRWRHNKNQRYRDMKESTDITDTLVLQQAERIDLLEQQNEVQQKTIVILELLLHHPQRPNELPVHPTSTTIQDQQEGSGDPITEPQAYTGGGPGSQRTSPLEGGLMSQTNLIAIAMVTALVLVLGVVTKLYK